MRIISGKYRGKKLLSPKNNTVRPTSNMIKESIFNTIQFDIQDSIFLDLFSGSGSMGIEAISRKAKFCYFIDSSKESINLINENLKTIKENNFKVLNKDYKDAIIFLKNQIFDYIFIDPPYKMDNINEILYLLYKYKLIDSSSLIIYEKNYNLKIDYDTMFEIVKNKKYSKTEIVYLRLK